ncbi:Permease of the drug/metabolite transporter (DMT) superfamily [Polaromonas sp. OV174]|uniref:DMT family transporter n=1 Tax=Polaromonas sp. OV174 TaxID=1855300 RepID=UPI0008E3B89D|nr:DMT family transporter [Polaromonas sp. OV174]SFC16079.1 Permease of the drug/metabolite transporter (DMT) superfamily [Polaromonas sp. OV174]
MSHQPPITAPSAAANFSFFPLLAVMIWTGNTLVTKLASVSIEPAAITFYRWLLAGLILSPFLLRSVWRQRAIVAAHWPKLAFLGLLGMGMYQGLAYEAAKTTSATNMGVVMALMPLLSTLLASLFAGEALTGARIGGAGLSLLGLVFLSTQGHPAELLRGAARTGDALMLVAIASNALYGVLLKRWAVPLSTWQQLYVQIGFGTLLVLPFWWLAPSSPITANNIPLILYAGTAASIGAPFLWMSGIKRLGPARASLFMNLLPLFVALAASTLLDEQLHAYHAVGGLLALAGVWWGQRQPRAKVSQVAT